MGRDSQFPPRRTIPFHRQRVLSRIVEMEPVYPERWKLVNVRRTFKRGLVAGAGRELSWANDDTLGELRPSPHWGGVPIAIVFIRKILVEYF